MKSSEGKSFGRILAVATGLLMVIPAIHLAGLGTPQESVATNTVLVYFDGENELDELRETGAEILETYDSFVLARTTSTQNDVLQSQGLIVEKNLGFSDIHINGVVIDTFAGEPELAPDLRLDSYRSDVNGHYLIQFHGPVKEEWKHEIERLGGRVLNYIPNNAFIVQLDGKILDEVAGVEEVQWLGIYHPAYKIRPVLLDMRGEVSVKIIIFKEEDLGQVMSSLHKDQIISHFQNEEFGVVKARVDASEISRLAKLNTVQYIEPIYEMEPTNQVMQWVMQTDDPNNRRIWDMGLHGEGQVIAVADTGLDYDHNFFRESSGVIQTGDIYNVTDMNRRKLVRYMVMSQWFGTDPLTDPWAWKDSAYRSIGDNDTTGHGTMVSGTLAGNDDPLATSPNDGIAKAAKIYLQDIGTVDRNPEAGDHWDDLLRYIPDDYHNLFWGPYEDGVRIHSNSWGALNTDYDLEAMMVDRFMWEYPDMLIVFSTGNAGTNGPGSPATAKSCISVGSHERPLNQDSVTSSSSAGPTEDGRRKPTVMAVGIGISSRSSGDPWDNSNPPDIFWGGTSYAGPVVAGLSAMTRQYFMEGWYPTGSPEVANGFTPSGALLKSTIVAAGKQMQGSLADRRNEGTWPNNAQGWGRVILNNSLYFPGDANRLRVVDYKAGLTTGESVEFTYFVADDTVPFKVIMAYSDYPGAVPTTRALVNNLDLTVTSPAGFDYKGNVFWEGQNVQTVLVDSRPEYGSYDNDNPLEGVLELTPQIGLWKVKITGTNVPSGFQPFGLTVLGGLDTGYGQLFLDKTTYGDSDTISIRVEDSDATSPLTVDVTSDTETTPEVVTLTETGTGVFQGSIDTAYGFEAPDGILQVSEGDTVTVEYFDSTPPIRTVQKTAVIDGAPPMITDVRATRITNSAATILWNTDESATSKVYYGTNPVALDQNVTKTPAGYFVSHSIDVTNLTTGTRYYFDVESADRHGHTTLDDKGGQHYSFVTTEKGEILLVIGDETFPDGRVERYKNAFERFGWSYNIWYVERRKSAPSLSLMQGYKVILWQTGLEEYPPFEDDERTLITTYIDEGGRFFLSSHDTAWGFAADSGSQWGTVQTGQWVNSTLKADWDADPYMWTHVEGVIGDPISNEYVGANRISYEPHRRGAAGDEITYQSYGGTPSYVWRDYDGPAGEANEMPVGLKWISSAANGTAGPGKIWGGLPSKLASYFLEVTGINFGTMNDYDRGSAINRTIVWLIGHDHPDVQVISPNGGEVFSGDTIQIQWSRQVYSTGINSQALFYSRDNGQSWSRISPDPAPGDTSYNWDITALQNGIHYLVKVVVQDDGNPYPMLNGSDVSDDTFTILRPGGDLEGPITIPGSVSSAPNPVERYLSVTFTATVDDTNFGNSTIQAAEFFMDTPGTPGLGISMNPVDIFDTPTEQVTWTGSAIWAPGIHCVFVHGQDVANNWGEFSSRCFTLLGKVVSPPSNFMAALTGPGFQDLTLTWDLSPDDPLDVVEYAIYYGNSFDPTAASYAFLAAVPNQTDTYLHSGAGLGGPIYYAIYSNGSGGDSTMAAQQAGKFVRSLSTGPQFVSVPITPSDVLVGTVFQTLEFDKIWTYDAVSSEWQTYMSFKPYKGDLTTVALNRGYWVNVTQAGDFVVAGWVQSRVTVQLTSPWTLVGYPSLTGSITVGDLKMLTGASKIEGYSASAPYFLQELADSYVLTPGEAYWVGNADYLWTVYI